jgi:hypothetical protein
LKQGKAAGIDDILPEQIKHLGENTIKWLTKFFNNCLENLNIPKVWRQSRIVALLKPGKDPNTAKNFRPISLLCQTYKLVERIILNRLSDYIDSQLIKEQAGFRPGKSTTGQLLNLTQHIEDGYEQKLITGTAFVDLSAAYDTVNHKLLLWKVYNITNDLLLTRFIRTLLENRRFYVCLGDKKSRWRVQKNGLPQGSVLAPTLFNIYTNDQPIYPKTRSFLYADDLCITTQARDFKAIEDTLTEALANLSKYYKENRLCANPLKTQVCAFHLNNRLASRKLNIVWNNTNLEHTTTPVYLGVTLDRALTYKHHALKTKAKVNARNNIIGKLSSYKFGANPETIRSAALALCFSTAEYACPVWARSIHAKKVDPALNTTCRFISGCLKATKLDKLYELSGINSPETRRKHHTLKEKARQNTDTRHPLHDYQPVTTRLKSRSSFMRVPLPDSYETPTASLPIGYNLPWKSWQCLNRLRSGMGRSGSNMVKWGLSNNDKCECGEIQTMDHILQCSPTECTAQDLTEVNDHAMKCIKRWVDTI